MHTASPSTGDSRLNLYGLDVPEIAAIPALAGQPHFRAWQIARWLYGAGVESFGAMTDLSKAAREQLEETCTIHRLHPAQIAEAGDGSAVKYLFILEDARSIEAVWIRDQRRDALCVSSQAGCAYGCTFCATAAMRAGRDLGPAEILAQVAVLREEMARRGGLGVHNLVFMGMGEPLANYGAVVRALRILCGEPGFGLAARRITISTVGLEPEIRRLAHEPLGVRLAYSLNATTDEVRSELMPINRKYPFRTVFEALREYQQQKKAPVTLEYVLLQGINDSREDARRLAGYARSLQCKVNLIAYNPHPFASFLPTKEPQIEEFRRWMMPIASTITVRWSKGRDIQAACGQLSTLQRRHAQGNTSAQAPGST